MDCSELCGDFGDVDPQSGLEACLLGLLGVNLILLLGMSRILALVLFAALPQNLCGPIPFVGFFGSSMPTDPLGSLWSFFFGGTVFGGVAGLLLPLPCAFFPISSPVSCWDPPCSRHVMVPSVFSFFGFLSGSLAL